MQPLGQLHGKEVAHAVDALCQQACTHAAMAGALVARGMSPADAFHTVMAWEGAGMTIPTRMHLPTMQSIPITGVTQAGIHGMHGMYGTHGMRQMMTPGITGMGRIDVY